ncbi:MAG: hypothetical protein SF187_26120 [Deltaproteobacteria bacterium]|nr:hypothetical protein [Deltaproteobacteria bacterium]
MPVAGYFGSAGFACAAEAAGLVLVTAAKTQLENISAGDLRQLFLGETIRDKGNQKLVPLNHQPGSLERGLFDQRVLGMSQDEMARYWIDQKVRGLKGPPRNLAPAQMVARVVERFPGAVSYLRPEHVITGLRMVRIENVEPGADNYLLADRGRK